MNSSNGYTPWRERKTEAETQNENSRQGGNTPRPRLPLPPTPQPRAPAGAATLCWLPSVGGRSRLSFPRALDCHFLTVRAGTPLLRVLLRRPLTKLLVIMPTLRASGPPSCRLSTFPRPWRGAGMRGRDSPGGVGWGAGRRLYFCVCLIVVVLLEGFLK